MGRLDDGSGQDVKRTAGDLSGRMAEVSALLAVAAGATVGLSQQVLAQTGAVSGLATSGWPGWPRTRPATHGRG